VSDLQTDSHAGASPEHGRLRVAVLPFQGDQNPYLALLTSSLAAHEVDAELIRGVNLGGLLRAEPPFDIVHLQWHHRLFVPRSSSRLAALTRGAQSFRLLSALRRRGTRIIWTVHNIVNHERRMEGWELVCCRRLARQVDALIVHCSAARGVVADAYGAEVGRIHVVPHGHYRDTYPETIPRDVARGEWGLAASDRVFLYFGQIRGYKGVDRLLEAFADLAGPDLRLVIAGMPRSDALTTQLREGAAADDRVSLYLDFLEEDRLVSIISASDVVVLPYADSLTSGAAVLASSLDRPVLMPAVGCMGQFPDDAAFLYDPADPKGLKLALRDAADAPLELAGRAARDFVTSFDWDSIGEQTRAIYDTCVA